MAARTFSPPLARRISAPSAGTRLARAAPAPVSAAVGVPRFARQARVATHAPDSAVRREAPGSAPAATPAPAAPQRRSSLAPSRSNLESVPAPRPDSRRESEAERLSQQVAAVVSPARARPPGPLRRLAAMPGLGPSPPSGETISQHRLTSSLRQRLEETTGYDLTDVTLVRGAYVDHLTEQFEALAFTHGGQIYVHESVTDSNTGIIAHEVAHVIQQRGGSERDATRNGLDFTAAEPDTTQPWSIRGALSSVGRWAGRQIKRGFWAIVRRISPQLEKSLKALGSQGIGELLSSWVTQAVELLLAPIRAISSFFGGAVDGIRSFAALLTEMVAVLPTLAQRGSRAVLRGLRGLAKTLLRITGGSWSALLSVFEKLWRAFSWITDKVGRALDFIFGLLGDVVRGIWDAIKWLVDKVVWVFERINRIASWAWKEIRGLLGFDSEGGGSGDGNGVMAWIKRKVRTVTDWVESIIGSVAGIVTWLAALGPLRALAAAVNSATSLGESMIQAADATDAPDGPAENQSLLRDIVLPAIQRGIGSIRGVLREGAEGACALIGNFAGGVAAFMNALAGVPVLHLIGRAFTWLGDRATELGDLAANAVATVFQGVDSGLQLVSEWVEPVLETLVHVASVVLNAALHLPALVLGTFWKIIPSWIRRPIRDFIVNRVLKRIPLLGQLITRLPDIWKKAVTLFQNFIRHVFSTGDLAGAAWEFFKGLLALVGVPLRLIGQIIAHALKTVGRILRHPFTFLVNLVRTIGRGLGNFIERIWEHLQDGLADWILGKLKSTSLVVPKEFSLEGMFSLVTQILQLTTSHLVEIVRQKRGGVAANAFQQALKAGSAAAGWIRTLAEKGPGGLWSEVAHDLSDLWDTIIDRMKEFAVQQVMARARRWLLMLVDVTGIMPAINTGIAIYRAIESFIANAQRIFGVIHSMFTAIADIAAGNLARGAALIEQAAANVLVVLIDFVANQVGLGKIADRIVEIIRGLRAKVRLAFEKLIDSTIDPLLALARRGAAAVSRGVGAALAWLGLRRTFEDASGNQHLLYFTGPVEGAELTVESTPRPLVDYLAEYESTKSPTQAERGVIAQIRTQVTHIENIKSARGTRGRGSFTQADGELIRGHFETILGLLPKLRGGENVAPPPTRIIHRETLPASGDGLKIVVSPLSLNPGGMAGGQPFGESPLWRAVSRRKRSAGGNTFYVRGHLLNHHLHGAGSIDNMIPITNTANGQMERLVETHLKQAVLNENRIVRFQVEAIFGSHGTRKKIAEESKLPTKIRMQATPLKKSGNNWIENKAAPPLFAPVDVPNVLPGENEGVITSA